MDEPNSAHSAACDGFNFLFDPTEKPTSERGSGSRDSVRKPGLLRRWESPSPGLQGFLEGKPFNQGDCRVCGMGRREGGLEDGSAGTNQELKTVADPLGDSGSFLWLWWWGPHGAGRTRARQPGERREERWAP